MKELDALARALGEITLAAAIPVMEVYDSDFATSTKEDASPVTEADRRAEAVILDALERVLPGVPVIAEERYSAGHCPEIGDEFLLVDPVDGTKEFIQKRGDFTINIGLIRARQPVVGVVYAPAKRALYLGGAGAWRGEMAPGGRIGTDGLRAIATRPDPAGDITAVMSRSHADAASEDFARRHGVTHTVSAGSSLKFCLMAEGRAQLYPRFGPTMEWDTAAGHGVLVAAGGRVTTPDEQPFLYAKTDEGFRNGPFVAWAG